MEGTVPNVAAISKFCKEVPMNRLFGVLATLLVASLLLWAADTGAQQQPAPKPAAPAPAPGAAPAQPAGEEKSVEGKIKKWDAATSMLTLDDGTQISVPAGAKVQRAALKEGAAVKASYEEKGGMKVAKSIQVTP
jgi:hypothetical protein